MKIRLKIAYCALALTLFAGVAATTTDGSKLFEMAKQIEIYTNLYKELNTSYVDEVDPAGLMRIGMDAMTKSLDPFTNYIAESDIEGYRLVTDGLYAGVGASYIMIDSIATVAEILNDSPAQKSGLQVGDQLIAINGRTIAGRSMDDIAAFLRGAVGTDLNLSILRPGSSTQQKMNITRAELSEENVPYSGMLRDGVGYIHLRTFTRNAASNVADALTELKKLGPLKGLVFDLRGNGGGLLSEAVDLVGKFVPKGEVIVNTRGREESSKNSFRNMGDPLDLNLPIVVLVDHKSASSSEIVSGALQDFDRAVIMGQITYGKGLVQHTRDIGYNAILKLTTAKYYIPSGRCIQAVQYENGKPVDIPEAQRAVFKTRNGRTVFDGGAIKPDVAIVDPTDTGLFKDLEEQHWIFRYATEYAQKTPAQEKLESIKFNDPNGFLDFLTRSKYVYTSEAQRLLDKAIKAAETDKIDPLLIENLRKQRMALQVDSRTAITTKQALVISLMEQELAGRSHFTTGKVQIGLRNDPEVEQAIDLLLNEAAYKKILSNK